MKRLILGVAAALLLGASPAAADGPPSRGHIKDVDAPFSWRGFYVGLHAGLATGNTQGEVHDFTTDYEVSGALYGVQAGWLGQWGNVVAGIEGTYSGANIQGNDGACVSFIIVLASCQREVNWLATVVGRAGLAYDRVLVYGLAGVAWAEVDTTAAVLGFIPFSGSETHVGWTAGFGVEWALSNRVSARIEYAHIDLGNETVQLNLPGYGYFRDKVELEMDTIRLGVNIKLGH